MSKLYFSYAAMNAGKSAILLQSSHNYIERGMHTLLLKPAIDTREGTDCHIVSRIGLLAAADPLHPDTNLETYIRALNDVRPFDCIFVDEAQFLTTEQVWQLSRIADHERIPVMCFGLRTDFKGELFPGSAALLAIADSLKEIKTLCWCGRKATMTLRVGKGGLAEKSGAQVEIGGNDRYISLCRKHWTSGQVIKPDGSLP